MDSRINIFTHAPKELTTDAFLVWLFYFLDSNLEYESYKQSVFDNLLLRPAEQGHKVSNISLARQENNVDVLLRFYIEGCPDTKTILFEDKTWSMPHGTQLDDYKKLYPNCYRYFYYKLGYVNSEELKQVQQAGYELINIGMITSEISTLIRLHPLIEMYYDYIVKTFEIPLQSYHTELFENHNYDILWDGDAQKYLCDRIVERMIDVNVPYIEIRNGSSYGRPWTQIDIAEKTDGYWEKLFWRVDIRSGKFYIRLNQYSEPSDMELPYKIKRRDILRASINTFVKENSGFKLGNVTSARKETEIAIFYLVDNDLEVLLDSIPRMTKRIVEVFNALP